MPQFPIPDTRASSTGLRIVRDEDGPAYDNGDPPAAARGSYGMIADVVLERLAGDGTGIAVYAVLAKHAGRAGLCWPTVEAIGAAVGWSKPTVIKALQRLTAAGVIVVEPRWSKGFVTANQYRLVLHPPVKQVYRNASSTGKPALPDRSTSFTGTGKAGST